MPATQLVSDRLRASLVATKDVTARDREQMFSLMVEYYENIDRVTFEADLNEKQWVIQLVDDEANQIRGFSTQVLLNMGSFTALFSGDTIVDRNYWARNELARCWGRFALDLIDAHTAGELYWFLITKGYKTYRFLPTFFREYYPSLDGSMPASLMRLVSQLAADRYPRRYNVETGIVAADRDGYRLRVGVAEITPERLRDPHVRFFVEKNPGHPRGDELCCIAPLTRENFTRAAYRVIGGPESSVVNR